MLRVLDWLRLSPLAPWHYLTYHKAFHFDVQPLLQLGWKPRYSNDEMFRESYDWFRANYDRLAAAGRLDPLHEREFGTNVIPLKIGREELRDGFLRVMKQLYEPFVRNGNPIHVMDVRSAEMVKYASNAMLAPSNTSSSLPPRWPSSANIICSG